MLWFVGIVRIYKRYAWLPMNVVSGSHPSELLMDQIADALATTGFIILDQPLPGHVVDGLIEHLRCQQAELKPAGIGRQQDHHQDNAIRSDRIQWLEPGNPAVTEFLSWMDTLRRGINQRLFLGLFDYESHFAVYAPGAFYQKHRDAFRGQPGRKLSTVFYLNHDWDLMAGGELVLYDDAGEQELVRLAPECGKLVLFLSEDFPHEVLPATRDRQSIAGWFRIARS